MAPVHVDFMPGASTGPEVTRFWNGLPMQRRWSILWDMPPEERERLFPQAVHAANDVGYAWQNSRLIGIAWLYAASRGGRGAAIHFVFGDCEPQARLAAGRSLLPLLSMKYDSLIGLIPVPFRGARRYVNELGFTEIGRLRNGCFIQRHNRRVDGVIVTLVMEE